MLWRQMYKKPKEESKYCSEINANFGILKHTACS